MFDAASAVDVGGGRQLAGRFGQDVFQAIVKVVLPWHRGGQLWKWLCGDHGEGARSKGDVVVVVVIVIIIASHRHYVRGGRTQ